MAQTHKQSVLYVGNDGHEVVINHPRLLTDIDGTGYMTFSPEQARGLARLLMKHADELERQIQSRVAGLPQTKGALG
jgi:hypothetical protein